MEHVQFTSHIEGNIVNLNESLFPPSQLQCIIDVLKKLNKQREVLH